MLGGCCATQVGDVGRRSPGDLNWLPVGTGLMKKALPADALGKLRGLGQWWGRAGTIRWGQYWKGAGGSQRGQGHIRPVSGPSGQSSSSTWLSSGQVPAAPPSHGLKTRTYFVSSFPVRFGLLNENRTCFTEKLFELRDRLVKVLGLCRKPTRCTIVK